MADNQLPACGIMGNWLRGEHYGCTHSTLWIITVIIVYLKAPKWFAFQSCPREGAEGPQQPDPWAAETEGSCSEGGGRAQGSTQDGGGDTWHHPQRPDWGKQEDQRRYKTTKLLALKGGCGIWILLKNFYRHHVVIAAVGLQLVYSMICKY